MIPDTLEPVLPTKTVDASVRNAVIAFLKEFCEGHFLATDPSARARFKQTQAAAVLGISNAHMSQLLRGERDPGLKLVLALAEATGAPYEEILGKRPSLRPKYPLARLRPDLALAHKAATEAEWAANERASSTHRSASPKPGAPRR